MSRAPFIFDFVALFLVIALPLLLWGVSLAGRKRDFKGHRNLQLGLALTILVVVGAFELALSNTDWREVARLSPFYGPNLDEVLYMHLAAASAALVLWVTVPVLAILRFSRPPRPGLYSKTHRLLGRLTVFSTIATAISGWFFYYLAFVAR